MKPLKKLLIPIAYRLLTVYWWLFRPDTYGVKSLVWYDGRVLLVRHSYATRVWKVPGGSMKKSEPPEEAILRELEEELQIEPKGLHRIGEYGSKSQYRKDNVTCFSVYIERDIYSIDGVELIEAPSTREISSLYRIRSFDRFCSI